jgi:hypothetical protein
VLDAMGGIVSKVQTAEEEANDDAMFASMMGGSE